MGAKTARRSTGRGSGRFSGKSKKPGSRRPRLRVVRTDEEGGDPEVRDLLDRWHQLVSGRENARDCIVKVKRQDHWFILEGWVDSFGTKGLLFSLVPEFEGARWIIDRIHVGKPA
jgi:hypothetical protein